MSTTDPTKSPHPDARARLLSHFQDKSQTEHPQGWDDLWASNFIPWDKGLPSPALVDLLTDRQDLLGPAFVVNPAQGKRRKRALVPGCGKGYDVLLLSAFGYDAFGLEYSRHALEEAKKEQNARGSDEVYKVRNEELGKGDVTWISGDFFRDKWVGQVDGNSKFDLIYDYTFLSALHPSMRPAWSARLNELLSATGKLVCLEFPTYKPPESGGPPWALPPKVYASHLPRPNQKLPYSETGDLLEKEVGPESESGLVCLEHFQPERTHQIGIGGDGKVTDWISVWSHKHLQ